MKKQDRKNVTIGILLLVVVVISAVAAYPWFVEQCDNFVQLFTPHIP